MINTINVNGIPEELKKVRQWVCWKKENREGKETKVPYQTSGNHAKINDSTTWTDFESAINALNNGLGFDGIGFVLTKEDNYVGIDLDHCCNAYFPMQIEPWAQEIIDKVNSYTEYSPSGKGIRIFIKNIKLPPGGRKKNNFEIYDAGHYLTITGNRVEGTPGDIKECSEVIVALHKQIFGETKEDKATDPNVQPASNLNVAERLERAFSSANGNKIKSLYDGDWSGQPSQSEADLALCSHLAFWMEKDPTFMDQAFRASGLFRQEKWDKIHHSDGRTYGQGTIQKAIRGCTEIYKQGREEDHKIEKAIDQTNNTYKSDEDKELIIDELNKNHAVIMVEGKCFVLNEFIEPTNHRLDFTLSKISDERGFYHNKKVWIMKKDQLKEISIIDLWYDSPRRREYKAIVFDPDRQDDQSYYNMYRGFDVEPKEGNWSLMRNHIHDIISSGNNEIFNYIMGWMARIVQDPGGQRPGTVIVLKGKQGTGKGCFVTYFGKIFGSHFSHIMNPDHLTGKFNNHLNKALLVFVDEGVWGGDVQRAGILKGMITEETIMCEPKGKDPFPVKNHSNIIIASNNDWIVPAGFEERRFFVLNVAEEKMQDTDYFEAIYNEMKNGGCEAMLYDLLHYNYSSINLRKFPRTEALFDQMLLSMPTYKQFWYEVLRQGSINSSGKWPDHYVADLLYEHYVKFSNIMGERRVRTPGVFGKKIKKLCPGIERNKATVDGGQKWCYFFPTLEECRKDFESQVNAPVPPWDDKSNIEIFKGLAA